MCFFFSFEKFLDYQFATDNFGWNVDVLIILPLIIITIKLENFTHFAWKQ